MDTLKIIRLMFARLFASAELAALLRYRTASKQAIAYDPRCSAARWIRNHGEGHTDHRTPPAIKYPMSLVPKDGSVFLLVLGSGVGDVVQAQWTDEDPKYPIRFVDVQNGRWIENRICVDACAGWMHMPHVGARQP